MKDLNIPTPENNDDLRNDVQPNADHLVFMGVAGNQNYNEYGSLATHDNENFVIFIAKHKTLPIAHLFMQAVEDLDEYYEQFAQLDSDGKVVGLDLPEENYVVF